MEAFFGNTWVYIGIRILGVIITLLVVRLLLKGVCRCLTQLEYIINKFCKRHNSKFCSIPTSVFAVLGVIGVTGIVDFNWKIFLGLSLQVWLGILCFLLISVPLFVKSKLFALVILPLRIISAPYYAITAVLCLIATFLQCNLDLRTRDQKERDNAPIVYTKTNGNSVPRQMTYTINVDGREVTTTSSPDANPTIYENGQFYQGDGNGNYSSYD